MRATRRRAAHPARDTVGGRGALRSAKRLEPQNLRQDDVEHAVRAVHEAAVLIPAGVAVFVPAPEAFAEVVVVVVPLNVVAVVPDVCVLIGVAVLEAGAPAVLPVRFTSPEAFLVPDVHGLTQRVRAVLIDLVVAAAATVAIEGS